MNTNSKYIRSATVMKLVIALIVLLGAVGLATMTADQAAADAGPHTGTFVNTTDACAACHRLHTGQAPKLLKEAQATLCLNCHNGTGSNLNVVDGLDLGGTPGANGLRGGGFTNTLMDTDMDTVFVSAAATSGHTYDGTAGTAWGNGAISAAPAYGASITLECGNCHNPHGNGQYRILRKQPLESGAAADVLLNDEVTKNYVATYDGSGYKDVSYITALGAPNNDISAWCSQCHTRHMAPTGSGQTDSGDGVFMYRHFTDGLADGCFNCHVAHGTSATMGTNSIAVPYPDGTSDGAQNSRLLHVDNRGVCIQCHQPGG